MSRIPLVLAFLLLSSPAAAALLNPGVVVRQVAAPEEAVTGITSITVGKVDGNWAGDFSKLLAAALADPDRRLPVTDEGAKKEKNNMGTRLAARWARMIPVAGDDLAQKVYDDIEAKVRKIDDGLSVVPYKIGAGGAVVNVTISGTSEEDRYTQTERRYTSSGAGYDVMVECRKRTIAGTLKWAVVAGGKTKISRSKEIAAHDTGCDAEAPGVWSEQKLAAAMVAKEAAAIANTILPAWRDHRIDFDAHKSVSSALADADKGDLQGALCKVEKAVKTETKSNVPLYDKGALLEALGFHDKAIESYEAADAMKAHERAREGAARVRQRKAEVESLTSAFPLKYTVPADFAWDSCP